jgi:ABC-type antimicrobial peptide transport system permease subunit
MDGLLNTYLAGRQVSLLAVGCFTAIAVLLASTGIYGVIASAVTRKRKDLAIRLALGAPQKTLVWSAIATGMTGACIGLAVGIAVAASLARFLESFLFGVKAFDWTVYFISAGAIILIAFLSSLASSLRVFDVTASEILRQ